MMAMVLDVVLSALLVMGGVFGLIGSIGLLKLRDAMQRLHAPTKATTLGVGTALVAAGATMAGGEGLGAGKEVLVTFFLFVTAPLSAFAMARTHLWRNIRKADLPPTGTAAGWAVLEGATPPDTRG